MYDRFVALACGERAYKVDYTALVSAPPPPLPIPRREACVALFHVRRLGYIFLRVVGLFAR